MPAFRKKPVVIEAKRLDEQVIIPPQFSGHPYDLIAEPGDWLIKGINGEMYPCKDDIFRATYEPVGKEGVFALLAAGPEGPVVDEEPTILKFPGVE